MRTIRRSLACLVLLLLPLFCAQGLVQAQQMGADFDHNTTGFQISGPHNMVRCESCHINGIFKGTPRDCANCHGWTNPRSSVVKSTTHMPTVARCESCHFSSSSSFKDAIFTHVGVRANTCGTCHTWSDEASKYPQIRSAPGDQQHQIAKDSGFSCDICHGVGSFATAKVPFNHIPFAPGAACSSCHVSADFSVMPTVDVIHANAPPNSTCVQCHGTGANQAPFFNSMSTMAVRPIVMAPDMHIPMGNQSCEACHVGAGSSITPTGAGGPAQVGLNAVFRGSMFSHAGIVSGCVTCHGPNVTTNYFGVTSILKMPAMGSPSDSVHMPLSSLNCENCHMGSIAAMPTLLLPVASRPANASWFGSLLVPFSALPTKATVHNGITTNCSSCHDTGAVWMGAGLYSRPDAYTGFQSRPVAGGNPPYGYNDGNHPTTGDCSQCHVNAGVLSFSYVAKPSNHIPTVSNSVCTPCHQSVNGAIDFWTMPSISAIHATLPAPANAADGQCGQCHNPAKAAYYNANMPSMVPPIVTLPTSPQHITVLANVDCGDCHVGSNSSMTLPVADTAHFTNSAFSHKNVVAGSCDSCHGANATVFYGVAPKTNLGLTPGHVPVPTLATVTCDTCHANSVPQRLVPSTGAVPGIDTTFAGGQFTHTGTTPSCAACHSVDSQFLGPFYGLSNLVVMPSTSVPGPLAHIPSGTACATCHAAPTGLVSHIGSVPGSAFRLPVPTSAQIHTGISDNCSSCHEFTSATVMPWVGMDLPRYQTQTAAPFAGYQMRPQAARGTYNVADLRHPADGDCSLCHSSFTSFTGPSQPANHIPYSATASCENCHAGGNFQTMPTLDAIHANAPSSTTNCAQCHGSAANQAPFFNTLAHMQPKIVMMPVATGSTPGHIDPGTLGCENCHVGSGSSLLTPVVQGMSFAGSAYSHAGMGTKTCADCHGASVTPTSFYGVQPKSTGTLLPAHVPTTQACSVCHTNTPSGLVSRLGGGTTYTFANASFIHTGISSGCSACHDVNSPTYYGLANIVKMPPTTTDPLGGTQYHMPTSNVCESCHTVSSSFITTIGTLGNSAFRSPPPDNIKLHTVIAGTSCVTCHEAGMSWAGVNVSSPYYTPHMSTPYTGFLTRPVNGGNPPYGASDGNHPGSGDCMDCHSGYVNFNGANQPDNHILYKSTAQCSDCHKATGANQYKAIPALTDIHQNTLSTSVCADCHSYTKAAYYSIPNVMTVLGAATNHIDMGTLANSCETCHINSSPYLGRGTFSGASYLHTSTSMACSDCHAAAISAGTFQGNNGTFRPKTNDLTPKHIGDEGLACDTCHTAGAPSGLVLASGAGASVTFANSKFSHSGITWGCASCHGDSVVTVPGNPTGGTYYGITSIIKMQAPTTAAPYGPTVHFPTPITTCETCHDLSQVSGAINVNPTYGADQSKFGTGTLPAKDLIHSGVTGGCSNCHESPMQWMGVTSTSIYRANMGPVFNGFQTRPQSAATTPFIYTNDPNHPPATGTGGVAECSNCHKSFTDFSAPSKGSFHIPTANTACSNCHVNPDYKVMPAQNLIHKYAPSQSGGCDQCHSTANVGIYGNTNLQEQHFMVPDLRGPTSDHMSMKDAAGKDQSCDVCHVGSSPFGGTGSFSNSGFLHNTAQTTCVACHGTINATSGAGTSVSFSTVASGSYTPVSAATVPTAAAHANSNHLPTSLDCGSCHALPTALVTLGGTNATTFANAQFSHSGLSGNCATCHLGAVPGNSTVPTFKGVSKLVQVDIPAPTSLGSSTTHLPTGTTCEGCHKGVAPTTPLAATGSTPAMGTTQFKLAAQVPTNTDIHASTNVGTATCNDCHENTKTWVNMGPTGIYPISQPTYTGSGALYTGFQLRPNTSGGGNITQDLTPHTQDASKQCSACHANKNDFSTNAKPVNHIPTTADCVLCHTDLSNLSTMPTKVHIHQYASTPTNCTQCHGTDTATQAPFFNTMADMNPKIVSAVLNPNTNTNITHVSISNGSGKVDCSNCHSTSAGESMSFANASFVHVTTDGCVACHGTVASTQPLAFTNMPAGYPKIVVPSHVPNPANLTCDQCHTAPASTVSYAYPYSTAPSGTGSTFAGGKFNHFNISTGCETCHASASGSVNFATGTGTFSVVALQNSTLATGTQNGHIPLVGTNLLCEKCHAGSTSGWSNSTSPATVPAVPATLKPLGSTDFRKSPPSGDLVHAGISTCNTCHEKGMAWVGMDVVDPAYTPSPTPSATRVIDPSKPLIYTGFQTRPGTVANGGGTGFAEFDAAHPLSTDTPSDCSSCHGSHVNFTTNATPSNHIPFNPNSGCNDCHTTAGATSNYSAPPGYAVIHANAKPNAVCADCHSASNAATYSRAANVATGTTAYTVTSPSATAAGLTGTHVPLVGSGNCEDCHIASGALANTPNTKTSVRVSDTASFLGAVYSHSGISGSCATCHQGSQPNYFGFPSAALIALPAFPLSTTAGANVHIPYNTGVDCVSCHVLPTTTTVTGTTSVTTPTLISLSSGRNTGYTAGSTGFLVAFGAAGLDLGIHPITTPPQSNCNVCHGLNKTWLGMTLAGYNLGSTVKSTVAGKTYAGFLTLPASPSTSQWTIADASHTPVDTCQQCHATGVPFSGMAPPAHHISYTAGAACSTCHITTGEWGYAKLAAWDVVHGGLGQTVPVALGAVNTTTLSALSSTSCASCHTTGGTGGIANPPPFVQCDYLSATQSLCPATLPVSLQPMTKTGSGGGGAAHSAVVHVPTTNSTVPTTVGGVAPYPTANAFNLDCNACHNSLVVGGFVLTGSPKMGATAHANAKAAHIQCQSCHERSNAGNGLYFAWTGVNITRRDSGHSGTKGPGYNCDNSGCHSSLTTWQKAMRIKPRMRAAVAGNGLGRQLPRGAADISATGAQDTSYDHQGVEQGKCKVCHNGMMASGMPGRHLMVSVSCDNCHRTSAWRPVQFSHSGAAATNCRVCHNGINATGKPAGHFMTMRACDNCHKTTFWTPVTYSHLSPAYTPGPGSLTCTSCHITNSEIIPHQMRGLVRTKPTPLGQ